MTITLAYNKATFIFGFFNNSKINIANNIFVLWVKYYIYKTKYQEGTLNINALLSFIKSNYQYLKSAHMINNQLNNFEKMWKPYEHLFIT